MTVWTDDAVGFARWDGGEWRTGVLTGTSLEIGGQQVVGARAASITDPAGGTTIDAEARLGGARILSALRQHGLVSA